MCAIIVDEAAAETGAETFVGAQRGRPPRRAMSAAARAVRLVRRVGGRPGIEPAARCRRGRHKSARPCRDKDWRPARRRGFPDASPASPGWPSTPHHDAAIVAAPDGAVGRQRIGAVALVAVDGRRGEGGGRARMREQAAEIMTAERRQPVRHRRRHCACDLRLDQRLMQMPAARHHMRQRRPAHEAREIAVAARDLLHRRAEQDHGVGGGKARLRAEGELAPGSARVSTSTERSGRPSAINAAPQWLDRRHRACRSAIR